MPTNFFRSMTMQKDSGLEDLMDHSILSIVEMERRLWSEGILTSQREENPDADLQAFREQMNMFSPSAKSDSKEIVSKQSTEESLSLALKSLALSLEQVISIAKQNEWKVYDCGKQKIPSVPVFPSSGGRAPSLSASSCSASSSTEQEPVMEVADRHHQDQPKEVIVSSTIDKLNTTATTASCSSWSFCDFVASPEGPSVDLSSKLQKAMRKLEIENQDLKRQLVDQQNALSKWRKVAVTVMERAMKPGNQDAQHQSAILDTQLLGQLITERDTLQRQCHRLQEIKASNEFALASLVKERDGLRRQCLLSEQVMMQVEEDRTQVKQSIEKRSMDLLQDERDMWQSKCKSKQESIKIMKDEFEDLAKQMGDLQDANERLHAKCVSRQIQISQLEDELERRKAKSMQFDSKRDLLDRVQSYRSIGDKSSHTNGKRQSNETSAAEAAVASLMAKVESLEELIQEGETKRQMQADTTAELSMRLAETPMTSAPTTAVMDVSVSSTQEQLHWA